MLFDLRVKSRQAEKWESQSRRRENLSVVRQTELVWLGEEPGDCMDKISIDTLISCVYDIRGQIE